MQALESEYIMYVIQLEQWLMEGAYNKVLDSRMEVPDQSYTYFMEKLLSTVRLATLHPFPPASQPFPPPRH